MTGARDDLFERACAAADIIDVARSAVKLKRSGKEYRGACPLSACGGKKSPTFVVQSGRQRWKCYVCEPRWGDAVDLEHRLHSTGGETMADAARRLLGMAPRDPAESERRARRRAQEAKAAEASDVWKAEMAGRTWRGAGAAGGGPVQAYLEGRGLYGPVLGRMLDQVRFHPRCYWGGHPEFGTFLPAMVALIVAWDRVAGRPVPTGGIHCTYLERYRPARGAGLPERGVDADGWAWRKASRDPAKKMFGPGGVWIDGRPAPGGVWLSPPDGAGELDVGEGMESTASASILLGGDLQRARRTVATLSLDRLQGGEAVDDEGRVDVRTITPDLDRPPFTWPEDPARPWGRVNVAVDRDMKPVKARGFVVSRAGRRRDMPFVRPAEERTRVCAELATAAWRRALAANSASVVRAVQPRPGRDFNDELMSRGQAS